MNGSNLRVVLLGKTGTGKSSLGNTLFGDDVFETDDSANCGTQKCEAKTRDVDGRNLTLIDTPGFFGTDKDEQHKDEVIKCITECAPGPHAFLILLKVGRFAVHEKEVIEKILKTFSEEALKYAIIVFTYGDQLREGMTVETFVQQSEGLRDLVSRCGGRCHVFDNRYWNQQDKYRSNQFQRGELLSTIDKMVEEHHGGCYTNDMLQQVETMIQKEEERIKQTAIMMKVIQMSLEEIREQAKKEVYHALKMCAGVSTGVLLGALLGVPMMVGKVVDWLRKAAAAFKAKFGERATEVVGQVGTAALGAVAQTSIKAAAAGTGVGTAAVATGFGAAAAIDAEAAGAAGAAAAAGAGLSAGAATAIGIGVVVTVAGAAVGACIGYKEAQEKTTIREAAESTASALWEETKRPFKNNQNHQQSADRQRLLDESN